MIRGGSGLQVTYSVHVPGSFLHTYLGVGLASFGLRASSWAVLFPGVPGGGGGGRESVRRWTHLTWGAGPATVPWAHIRGRYWSAKIDKVYKISLWSPVISEAHHSLLNQFNAHAPFHPQLARSVSQSKPNSISELFCRNQLCGKFPSLSE
jgi:hypothetical protein